MYQAGVSTIRYFNGSNLTCLQVENGMSNVTLTKSFHGAHLFSPLVTELWIYLQKVEASATENSRHP